MDARVVGSRGVQPTYSTVYDGLYPAYARCMMCVGGGRGGPEDAKRLRGHHESLTPYMSLAYTVLRSLRYHSSISLPTQRR